MATKNNPGPFDCFANALPDEPMFVLLGRDKNAPSLVLLWAREREAAGEGADKVAEARACAEAMRQWLVKCGKGEEQVAPSITLTHEQIKQLAEICDGDEPGTEVTLCTGNGHSGPGTYAWFTELPEEGSFVLTNGFEPGIRAVPSDGSARNQPREE